MIRFLRNVWLQHSFNRGGREWRKWYKAVDVYEGDTSTAWHIPPYLQRYRDSLYEDMTRRGFVWDGVAWNRRTFRISLSR